MVIFYSYVSLPEGIRTKKHKNFPWFLLLWFVGRSLKLLVAAMANGMILWFSPITHHLSMFHSPKKHPGSKLESCLATPKTFRKLGNSQFGSDSRTLPVAPWAPADFRCIKVSSTEWLETTASLLASQDGGEGMVNLAPIKCWLGDGLWNWAVGLAHDSTTIQLNVINVFKCI